MILARFFRPKWQHPSAAVRRQALVRLSSQTPAERAVLCSLAEQDPEVEVRKAAVKRVADLRFLHRRMREDDNAGVREVAGARYRQLLAGGTEAADLSARLQELATCGDEAVLAHVARRGREADLRMAALERLPATAVLEEIAVHDDVPKLRQAAVLRLTEPASLERVMRQTRERDRKVARIAREALDRLQRQREAAEQADAERGSICDALERLADAGWSRGSDAERRRLENRWQAVADAPKPQTLQRYREAQRRCDAAAAEVDRREASAPSLAEPAAADPEALLAVLRQEAGPDPARLALLRDDLAAIEAALPADRRDDRQQRCLALLEAYLQAAARYLEHEHALDAATAELRQADPADAHAVEAAARRLQAAVDAVDWRLDLPAPEPLRRAAAALADSAQRQARHSERRDEQRTELAKLLAASETSLAAGRLKQSQRLLARAQTISEHVPPADRQRLDRRLKQHAARVRELRDWRRFASLPKQMELCEQMETLATTDLPLPELAARVQQLREQWKATGGSGSAEAQQLWERFRSAGDRAFDRCRGYFEEQARRRQANLERRREIVDQLDRFVAAADWDRLDLAGLEAIRAQARAEWQAASPVDRRELDPLQSRFESRMEALSGRIRDKQRANRERKQALVAKARLLAAAEDARAAAQEAKALQAQWKAVGPAQPNMDRRLWREFRGACDDIFRRRDEARGELDQERKARLAQAEALCVEAETLVADENIGLAEVESRLTGLRERYQALRPLPREQVQACSQRLHQAERALDERRRRQARQREQSALAAARARARICAELEQAALSGESVSSEPLQQRWRASDPAPGELQARLEARWQRALVAAGGDRPFAAEELATNRETRHELCLWMEILAGVEPPPEDRARRLDLQVRRLADGMAAGQQRSALQQASAVEIDWLAAGPAAPSETAAVLERRFEAARERILASA